MYIPRIDPIQPEDHYESKKAQDKSEAIGDIISDFTDLIRNFSLTNQDIDCIFSLIKTKVKENEFTC